MTYRPKRDEIQTDHAHSAAYAVCSLIAGALLVAAIGYVATRIEGPDT